MRFMQGFMHRFGHRFRRPSPEGKQVTLAQMQNSQSGVVIEIQGGCGVVDRLSTLNIRPSRRITKVSSMLVRGPITIQVGSAQVAIGFGMAKKIIVKPD
jgi:ferrous iron transport protein A